MFQSLASSKPRAFRAAVLDKSRHDRFHAEPPRERYIFIRTHRCTDQWRESSRDSTATHAATNKYRAVTLFHKRACEMASSFRWNRRELDSIGNDGETCPRRIEFSAQRGRAAEASIRPLCAIEMHRAMNIHNKAGGIEFKS